MVHIRINVRLHTTASGLVHASVLSEGLSGRGVYEGTLSETELVEVLNSICGPTVATRLLRSADEALASSSAGETLQMPKHF